MYELSKTHEITRLIEITKSNSGISGPPLAEAHIALGRALSLSMRPSFPPAETTVVAMLRGGIFFAAGLYFSLGCQFALYDPHSPHPFQRPQTKYVILADSVVNTGRTILDILTPDMHVACCVINEKAVPLFADQLYTVRISRNSFVGREVRKQEGNVGPDTTMRLFNQI